MKKITILLSTYNGKKYIKEQLDSIFNQTYKNIEIIVRDDGSSDNTIEILKSYNIEPIDTKINLGAMGSFEELLKYAVQNSNSDYFMFCDQDDVWEIDKVEKTLAKMQEMKQQFGDIPLLVHTNLEVVDESLNTINDSFMNFQKIDPKKNNFHNLLIQNTITGCTVMINRKLAQMCLPIPDGAIMHDWWIGLLASQFGKIGYIDEATIKYRQHTSNTIGAKGFDVSFVLKSISKKVSLGGNISQAKAFLEKYKDELDVETIKMLEDFTTLEQKSWWQKRVVMWKYKLLKQGLIRNAGLFFKI
ncbi:glycosyltransferase family 2 protein [Aliarcobacter skirrowii]|uniref:glycosyltransferase family 2 protein n=1 Tax=Aliarcobacter skirrowii TaxID=28200 RepID=UPI000D61CF24|nr:glycosyltransferase family 2 protein [Aliarcobacter skirrowii]PWE19061.1 glycosyl transferase family 2 [Aliarcobacter skirrowii]PWE24815.1 glycosyl transferase family 2 [Aliarcobacter skirrowii]RJO55007.1 glycosyltransferase family 2 protein [Aliarcobacter skirrowii]RJO57052.1 glycosyltransferase family 2 protein [Aliarcobacter skirrowii]